MNTGKGPNIWDTFVRQPGAIYNDDTGDVATDSYHKYPEDINLLRALKVTVHESIISMITLGNELSPSEELSGL